MTLRKKFIKIKAHAIKSFYIFNLLNKTSAILSFIKLDHLKNKKKGIKNGDGLKFEVSTKLKTRNLLKTLKNI